MPVILRTLFEPDLRHQGVRRISIHLLRTIYALMFFMLGSTTWTEVLTHRGAWEPHEAVAWSIWTAFATLAGVGIVHPLKMIPILLLEIFYKVLWLILVAWPLWSTDALAGSPAEGIASVFWPVIVVIAIVPWRYVFKHYARWNDASEHDDDATTAFREGSRLRG